jgi:hypothetical protein
MGKLPAAQAGGPLSEATLRSAQSQLTGRVESTHPTVGSYPPAGSYKLMLV